MREVEVVEKGSKWHWIPVVLIVALTLGEWTGAFVVVARISARLNSKQWTPNIRSYEAGFDRVDPNTETAHLVIHPFG